MGKVSKLRLHRYSSEWLLLGIALVILGASISFWLVKERAEIDARERDRLQAQARVIDQNLVHQLTGTNGALLSLMREFPGLAVKSRRMEAAQHLRAIEAGMTGVRSIFLLDDLGKLVAASWANFIPDQDFSHRDYFKTPHERSDPSLLYVSAPFTTITGTYSLNISRIVVGPNGAFRGLVTATLDPEYFEVILRSVLYATDMVTSIIHADGMRFVVQPANQRALGKNLLMPNSNFSRYQESGKTEALMVGIADESSELRLRAYRTVSAPKLNMDKPLVITVGRNEAAMFASWRSEAMINFGFFCLFAIALSINLHLSQARRGRSYAARRAAEEALRVREERYRVLFDRASDGIMILSLEGKLVAVNESFARMHGYTPEEMQKLNLKELDTPETFQRLPELMQRVLAGETLTFEVEHYHKDGHIVPMEVSSSLIHSESGPLIQAFHRDITERKRQRELIEESNAMLTRQKAELEESLGRVKRLEGLISICMCCKKMRTENNAWQQLEQYIAEHSDAVFSHGLCPECYAQQIDNLDVLALGAKDS